MSIKEFDKLYDIDVRGEELSWKWDESEKHFYATDSLSRTYTLRPTHAVMEIEEIEEDDDDDE